MMTRRAAPGQTIIGRAVTHQRLVVGRQGYLAARPPPPAECSTSLTSSWSPSDQPCGHPRGVPRVADVQPVVPLVVPGSQPHFPTRPPKRRPVCEQEELGPGQREQVHEGSQVAGSAGAALAVLQRWVQRRDQAAKQRGGVVTGCLGNEGTSWRTRDREIDNREVERQSDRETMRQGEAEQERGKEKSNAEAEAEAEAGASMCSQTRVTSPRTKLRSSGFADLVIVCRKVHAAKRQGRCGGRTGL